MTVAPQHSRSGLAHASRRENARPANRVARSKTASGIFFSATPKTHPANATQTLGTHQRNWVCGYDFAPGCVVAPNKEQLKKECAGLASIIGTFQGEAQKALNQFNNQLGYSQRLAASFASDNRQWITDLNNLVGDYGIDAGIYFMGPAALGGQLANVVGEFYSTSSSASAGDNLQVLGHMALAGYYGKNLLTPNYLRSPGFGTISRVGGPLLFGGGALINIAKNFEPTRRNEVQQASIMEERNQVTSGLMNQYLQQDGLVKQFQQQWKDKGCDKL